MSVKARRTGHLVRARVCSQAEWSVVSEIIRWSLS